MCDAKTQSVRSATVVAGSQHQRPHAPLCLHQLQHLSPSGSRKQAHERIPAHIEISDRWGGQQQAAEQQSYIGHPPSSSSAAGTSVPPPAIVLQLCQGTIDLLGSDAYNTVFELGGCCILRFSRVASRDFQQTSNPHTFHSLPCFITLWGNWLCCAAQVKGSK